MTMVDVVSLQAPNSVTLSPSGAPPGSRFTIFGTNMDGVLGVVFSSNVLQSWIAAARRTPTSAEFLVPHDPKGVYTLGSVVNACAASSASWMFTIE